MTTVPPEAQPFVDAIRLNDDIVDYRRGAYILGQHPEWVNTKVGGVPVIFYIALEPYSGTIGELKLWRAVTESGFFSAVQTSDKGANFLHYLAMIELDDTNLLVYLASNPQSPIFVALKQMVNLKDAKGNTPLFTAASADNHDIYRILRDTLGGDETIVGQDGFTPRQMLEEEEGEELSYDGEDYENDEDYQSNDRTDANLNALGLGERRRRVVANPEEDSGTDLSEEDSQSQGRAIDFGDQPALPPLEALEVTYTTEPMVYDFTELGEVSMLEVVTGGEQLVFKLPKSDTYNCTPGDELLNQMEDRSSVFYECKAELDGAPYVKDVFVETPYFRLRLNGNFMIPMASLVKAINSRFLVFELVETVKKIEFLAAFSSVQITPGVDGLGRQVNIVSADHCQKGSHQDVYELKGVKLVHAKSSAGRRRRKTFRKGKKKGKKQTRKRRV
jgi:hypothetical protein